MLACALNHMTTRFLEPVAFMELAHELNCVGVEFRNDLEQPLFARHEPREIAELSEKYGLEIIALAEVKAFNDFNPKVLEDSLKLMATAKACGAKGISLIPHVDQHVNPRVGGNILSRDEQKDKLVKALNELKNALQDHELMGFIEPIGFRHSTLQFKSDAVEAIKAVGGKDVFALIHDTFHHHIAGEQDFYADYTALVHVSGVNAPVAPTEMTDADRGLVDEQDKLQNLEQLKTLTALGYNGAVSMEAFAPSVHSLSDPRDHLSRSFTFINSHLKDLAA